METTAVTNTPGFGVEKGRSQEIKKQEVATAFEEIFARQLVREMTKGSFKMDDKNSLMGSGGLYRTYIVDTLATELAKQHKLGMAELINEYWQRRIPNANDNSQ